MAMHKVLFVVGILQLIGNLVSITFCSEHFYNLSYHPTELPNNTALFALRIFPAVIMTVTGMIGIILSCLHCPIVKVIHITMTSVGFAGELILLWYFTGVVINCESDIDITFTTNCLIAVAVNAFINLLYLVRSVIMKWRSYRYEDDEQELKEIDSKSSRQSSYVENEFVRVNKRVSETPSTSTIHENQQETAESAQ